MGLPQSIKRFFKDSPIPFVRDAYEFARRARKSRKTRRRMARVARGQGQFITLEDLTAWTKEWIKEFPENYDLIVGVPRSGLFVATIIALKLGKPLTTPDLFVRGESWKSKRMPEREQVKVLLVEDCLSSGRDLERCHKMMLESGRECQITRAAAIVHDKVLDKVDLYYRNVPFPRFFEWEFVHHKKAEVLAVDMDGVLCENCPREIDLDEARYLEWLPKARPYLLPFYEIDYIVTNRLEKYRPQTEEWLARNRIRYRELLMWDLPDKARRSGWAKHKAEELLRVKPDMFVESNMDQAAEIWRQTSIPTLCADTQVFFHQHED